MDEKKIEYLKKHLEKALEEKNYSDVNYCFQELSSIPNVDISEIAKTVNAFNNEYKSTNKEKYSSKLEEIKEELCRSKAKSNIVSKIQFLGLAGGVAALVFGCLLMLMLMDIGDLMWIGIAIEGIGFVGIILGTIFSFIKGKVYTKECTIRRSLFKELCESQEKFKYLDNVEEVKFAGVTNYKGQVVNGNREGFGISVNHVGYFYIGEWSKGEKSGIGKLVTDDMKMVLEGEFLSDLAHGTVDISWEDGSEWHGEYRQGFPWNGSGKAILPWNGNSKIMLCTKIQEGVWKNGLKVQ